MGSYVLSVEVIMSEKATPAKASKMAKAKKPAAKPSHPPTSVMVEAAIKGLKEGKGSSLIAIKKYIATNYKVDPVKNNHFIKKALASGVEKKPYFRQKASELLVVSSLQRLRSSRKRSQQVLLKRSRKQPGRKRKLSNQKQRKLHQKRRQKSLPRNHLSRRSL